MLSTQNKRLLLRTAFFTLFVLAPPLDIFRLDLTLGHFILFGHPWTLGVNQYFSGQISSAEVVLNIFVRVFLPLIGGVALVIWISWKYGRLYCGWLCPHYSVVEAINGLMRRTIGKQTLWDKAKLPEQQPDGKTITPNPKYWWVTIPAIGGFAFLWAVALLTYLLPPAEIYSNLWQGSLTRNQSVFITTATLAFVVEFTLARHLFCRFGCAVGLFQSLAWMANKKGMVVGFNRERGQACNDCNNACDNACSMRLKPRTTKRHMFACTQCGQCVQACKQVQHGNPEGSLLQWVEGACALDKSDRDFGHRPPTPEKGCFNGRQKTQYVNVVSIEKSQLVQKRT